MKVAVSIPDPIFQQAERVSRRMRVPRSQLYARALEAYVREHSGEEITQRLNEVYANVSSSLEPAVEAVSLEVLRREKW
jgi:metal-responsive CopG/Arc/MetJ family transcriptional regulator